MDQNIKKYSVLYSNSNKRTELKKINNGNINMLEEDYVFEATNKGTPNIKKKFDLKTAMEELNKYHSKKE